MDGGLVCGPMGPMSLTCCCRDLGGWLEDVLFVLPILSTSWLFTVLINQLFSDLEEEYILLNHMHCDTYPRGTNICGGPLPAQSTSQVSPQATISHRCNFHNWNLSFFGVVFTDVPLEIRFLNLKSIFLSCESA